MNNSTNRDKLNGQYAHKLEHACKCGHRKGQHDAEKAVLEGKPYQPCQEDGCTCECFKATK